MSVARRVGSNDPRPTRPRRAHILRWAPILLAGPFMLALLRGGAREAASLAVAFVLFQLAASLVSSGFAAQAEYDARDVARPPFPPRKILGAVVAAGACFVAAWGATAYGMPMAIVFTVLGLIGTSLLYGTDPLRTKGVPDAFGVRSADVIAAVDEAERKLREIEQAAGGIRSRELQERIASIVLNGRKVLRLLEKDPRDIGRARRFLATYLDGARNVVTRYADQQHDLVDSPLAENFRRVLSTIEAAFVEQQVVLKQDDKLDLDVQIDVLETQLKREGVV